MANQKKTTFLIEGITKLDISQAEASANKLKNALDGINLPENIKKQVGSTFADLSRAIADFRKKQKEATSDSDWKGVRESGEKVVQMYNKMFEAVQKTQSLTQKQKLQLIPPDTLKTLNKAKAALRDYKKNLESLTKKRNTLQGKKEVQDDLIREYKKQAKESFGTDSVKELQAQNEQIQKQIKLYDELNKKKDSKTGLSEEESKTYDSVKISLEDNKQKSDKLVQTIRDIQAAQKSAREFNKEINTTNKTIENLDSSALDAIKEDLKGIINIDADTSIDDIRIAIASLEDDQIEEIEKTLSKISKQAEGVTSSFQGFENQSKEIDQVNDSLISTENQMEHLKNQMLNFFSLTNGWQLLKRGIKEAYDTVKEMDDAMTEIAVVSDYTVDEIWEMRDSYAVAATQMGAKTIDMVNAQKLYIQQGLDLAEAQNIATETLRMGRIANLDGTEATNLMTAAVRGFNMEMTEAARVNDVYSVLAAKSAADTKEIATAMSKTASIANSAGASFENTSAFLTQIIETTREAPETAGTALKTIIARFQELKKAPSEIGEVDGEMVNANNIEKALKTAEVALRDANGQFREFDDVILELSSKWDTLDVMTQRYIATQAAGSRQQSRFLALMSDNERLLELTGYAANSAGAANEQFGKTLDSLDSKINALNNQWELFLQGLADNQTIKGAVDLLTKFLDVVNKATGILPGFGGSILKVATAITLFHTATRFITAGFVTNEYLVAGREGGANLVKGIAVGIKNGSKAVVAENKRLIANIKKTFANFKNPFDALDDYKNKKAAIEKLTAVYDKFNKAGNDKKSTEIARAAKEMYNSLKLTTDQQKMLDAAKSKGIRVDQAALIATSNLTEAEKEDLITKFANKEITEEQLKTAIKSKALKDLELSQKMALIMATLFGNKVELQKLLIDRGLIEQDKEYTRWELLKIILQEMFNTTLLVTVGIVLAVVAAGAVLIAMWKHYAKVNETAAEKTERLNQQVADAATAATEAKDAYSELQETLSNWKNGLDGLDSLVKGTREYNEAILESNQNALELLNKYEMLGQYITTDENGLITFDQEGLDILDKRLADNATIMQGQNLLAQLESSAHKLKNLNNTKIELDASSLDGWEKVFYDSIKTNERRTFVYDQSISLEDLSKKIVITDDGKLDKKKSDLSGLTNANKYLLENADSLNELRQQINEYNIQVSSAEKTMQALAESAIRASLNLEGLSNIDSEVKDGVAKILAGQYGQGFEEISGQKKGTAFQSTLLGETLFASGSDKGNQNLSLAKDILKIGLKMDVSNIGTNSEQEFIGAVMEQIQPGKLAEDNLDKKLWDDFGQGYADEITHLLQEGVISIYAQMFDELAKSNSKIESLVSNDIFTSSTNSILSNIQDLEKEYFNYYRNTLRLSEESSLKLTSEMLEASYNGEVERLKENQKLYKKLNKAFKITGFIDNIDFTSQALQVSTSKPMDKHTYINSTGKTSMSIPDQERAYNSYLASFKAENSYESIDWSGTLTEIEKNSKLIMTNIFHENEDLFNHFGQVVGGMAETVSDIFIQTYKNINAVSGEEGSEKLLDLFEEVGDSSIKLAAAVNKAKKEFGTLWTESMQNAYEPLISVTAQANEFYDILSSNSEAMEALMEDGEITATEIVEFAKSNELAGQMMEQTGSSAYTLAKYYELLHNGVIDADKVTDDFIETLDRLNKAQGTIEDSFAFIDNFDKKRATAEIGEFWSEMSQDIVEMAAKGQYGDPLFQQLLTQFFGENKIAEILGKGTWKDVYDQFANQFNAEGTNMYDLWIQAAEKLNSVSIEDGQIKLKMDAFTDTKHLIEQLIGIGFSEELAKAMVADFQTYSSDGMASAQLQQKDIAYSQSYAILDYLAQYGHVMGDTLYYNDEALKAFAKSLGIAEGDLTAIFNSLKTQLGIADTKLVSKQTIGEINSNETVKAFYNQFNKEATNNRGGKINYDDYIESFMKQTGADEGSILASLLNQTKWLMNSNDKAFSNDTVNYKGKTLTIKTEEDREEWIKYLESQVDQLNLTFDPSVWTEAQQQAATENAKVYSTAVATGIIAGFKAMGLVGEDFKSKSVAQLVSDANNYIGDSLVEMQDQAYANYKDIDYLQKTFGLDEETAEDYAERAAVDPAGVSKLLAYSAGNTSDIGAGAWEEPYDWLYNGLKTMEAHLRAQERLEEEYEEILQRKIESESDYYSTIAEVTENLTKQSANLKTEKNYLTQLLGARQAELKALMQQDKFKDVAQYVDVDYANGTFSIKDEILQNNGANLKESQGALLEELVNELERVEGDILKINDDLNENDKKQRELQQKQIDAQIDLESRLIDAIEQQRQNEIDKLQEISDAVADANSELISKIQDGIDESRNAREQDRAREDIEEKERRLALLRSDTSGANILEIKALEDELTDARESYVDTEIDNALERLNKQNDEAREQRERQIEIMQKQLEEDKKNGTLAKQADDMIVKALETGLVDNITNLLKESDTWTGMGEFAKLEWFSKLAETLASVFYKEAPEDFGGTNIIPSEAGSNNQTNKTSKEEKGTTLTDENQKQVVKEIIASDSNLNQVAYKALDGTSKKATKVIPPGMNTRSKAYWADEQGNKVTIVALNGKHYEYNPETMQYATGGLNTTTGLAWLDGTRSRPEYVLNAEQTQAFLSLVPMLKNLNTEGGAAGNTYFDVHIEVDEISSDYDVEQMADQVKRLISQDANYRNSNAVELGRR